MSALPRSAFIEFGNTKVIFCLCEYLFVLLNFFFYNFIIFISGLDSERGPIPLLEVFLFVVMDGVYWVMYYFSSCRTITFWVYDSAGKINGQ